MTYNLKFPEQETTSEIIKQIIKNTKIFQKLINSNWEKVDRGSIHKVTNEYLTFIMYCAMHGLQGNKLAESELEEFHKLFYSEVVKNRLLIKDELLDYEKLSRERYMDFYHISFPSNEKELTGERLNSLVAKETLHIQKMLSNFKEKENTTGSLYSELFAVYNGLMLEIQLMFNLKPNESKI